MNLGELGCDIYVREICREYCNVNHLVGSHMDGQQGQHNFSFHANDARVVEVSSKKVEEFAKGEEESL